jgi:hypothetical protein
MSKQRPAEICCDEIGLTVTVPGSGLSSRTDSLTWNEIEKVVAYKRDLYTIDLICLGFATAKQTIELNEEMHGWSQLVEKLPSLLPGTPEMSDWWERVAKPPFAPSIATLFKRA